MPIIVAMDGPSGAGKSSTSKAIAKRAGWDLRDLGFANWITEDPVASFKEHGAWNSPGFLPGMGVRGLYMDRYEFAGIVANSRVFRSDPKKFIHFNGRAIQKNTEVVMKQSVSITVVDLTNRFVPQSNIDYIIRHISVYVRNR